MPEVTRIDARKADHIRINLEKNVHSGLSTGLEHYRFVHRALPELDLDAVTLSQTLFGRQVKAPILISSMTGGTNQAQEINLRLAEAAQAAKVVMGVGSQRAALEHPELAPTFQVRKIAPDILLFANLGAVQLNYGYTIDHCQRAVDMLEADALVLHINPIQEAVQPEGNTRFSGLLKRIEEICRKLPVPVIAKEVGWGFSLQDVVSLVQAGISALDVAGAGGTSWSQVEMHRARNPQQARLASAFIDWGIPTAECLEIARLAAPDLILIGSGGLRTGTDIAKCLALGACLGGMASPFLKAAVESSQAVFETLEGLEHEIRIILFGTGSTNLEEFQHGATIQKLKA
jgi:isopentenyl-diphosphate delta-isomerase